MEPDFNNEYIPILINEILEPVLTKKKIFDGNMCWSEATPTIVTRTAQAAAPAACFCPTPLSADQKFNIDTAISDVETTFFKKYFMYEDPDPTAKDKYKFDFNISKILKGEIFDITASSTNNELGALKSRHFQYKTTLQDISDELNYIKRTTQDDKSIKREIRLNFIENCIELDNNDVNTPFNALFEILTAYINGSNHQNETSSTFIVKNSGGNIFKLYAGLLYLIFEHEYGDIIQKIHTDFKTMLGNPDAGLIYQIKEIIIKMFRDNPPPTAEKYIAYNLSLIHI